MGLWFELVLGVVSLLQRPQFALVLGFVMAIIGVQPM